MSQKVFISNPKRPLDPAVEKTIFEDFCDRIVPYVLLIAIIILLILVFVILVKYGGAITGTEANRWYNGGLI